ncbi:hypothetical protein GWK47_035910 [Chionoecetes opilio]|uniref:Uncharacterized protein n=1 Tax=Chionoecetes opilio TaxID=41210 RepID=A0A8J5D2Y2_CHIOP|nr:hypothetical protein GWK47_035910 [Chionoecetes opilio]
MPARQSRFLPLPSEHGDTSASEDGSHHSDDDLDEFIELQPAMVHTRLEPSDHDVDFEGFNHEGFLQGFLSGERGDSDDVAGTSGADTSANVPTGSPTEDVLPGPSAEAPTATTETDEADVRESHSDEEAAADGVEITRVPKKGRKREAKSAQWVVCTAKRGGT